MEYVTLSNGVKMPILGYDVYQVTKDECERCVLDALEAGYSSLDTAQSYFNEEGVGSARKKSSIPREDRDRPAGAMKELIGEGKITHWGISEADEDTLRRAHAVCPVTAVQNRYSMMYRDYEKLFPVLEELHIGFVAFSPLANGLLTAKYNKDSQFEPGTDYRSAMPKFTREAFDQNDELLRYLIKIADRKEATPAQISLAWMMAKKPWIVPIPGTRKYGRLIENMQAADVELTEEEVNAIDRMLEDIPMSDVFGGSRIKSRK